MELLGNHALGEFVFAPTDVWAREDRWPAVRAPLIATHAHRDRFYLVAAFSPALPYGRVTYSGSSPMPEEVGAFLGAFL